MRKHEENLSATSQLIRFIRGGVTCEEFYTLQPGVNTDQRAVMVTWSLAVLAGLFLILAGYLVLSRQLKADRYQLAQLVQLTQVPQMPSSGAFSGNRESAQAKTFSSQDLEARRAFWKKQEALYQELIGEKLSMNCVFKELSHLSPANVFFRKVSLIDPQQPESGRMLTKSLILEGTAIKTDTSADGDFPTFLTRLNQSSFFQKVQVSYQKEADTDYGHGLDFVLTCDLK
jgi:hypothetical protein